MDFVEVSDMVLEGAGIEKRGRRRGFSKQTIGFDNNLKNKVSQKELRTFIEIIRFFIKFTTKAQIRKLNH